MDQHTQKLKELLEPSKKNNLDKGNLREFYLESGRIISSHIEKFPCLSNDEKNEINEIAKKIKYDMTVEHCLKIRTSPRYDLTGCTPVHQGEINILKVQNTCLFETVDELKREINIMKSEKSEESAILHFQTTHLLDTIKELKKEVDTLKAVISGKGDVMNAVKVIQRYWRKFLLLKNIKRLAREYEAVLLREFRKSLTMKSSSTNKNLLSAAESRVRPPSRASGSNPENWSVAKAATIASDWNS